MLDKIHEDQESSAHMKCSFVSNFIAFSFSVAEGRDGNALL
jgi:hypothetical protein